MFPHHHKPNTLVAPFFFAAVVILLSLGLLFYRNISAAMDAAQVRTHTHLTIEATDTFLSHLKDAETGQRGYLLTGQTRYLQPYLMARDDIKHDWPVLDKLYADSAFQERVLKRLKPLTAEKLAELKETITLNQNGHPEQALAVVRTDRGKVLMDRIRAISAEMQAHERKLLIGRDDAVRENFSRTIVTSIVGGIAALILLIAAYSILRGEMRARLRANQDLEREIEERRAAEIRVLHLNEQLESHINHLDAVNKELEAFSYSVSHDLRAPLRSIDGFSQALLQQYPDVLDDKGKDYLNRVRSNTQRMARLIDDLLQLSRLSRGELAMETVDLSALARSLDAEQREQNPDRVVETTIADGLIVRGDRQLLQAVMQNLIGNAWKFTGGKDVAQITFGLSQVNGKSAYFVRDNGAGFDMAYVHKLFGAFQRLHGMKEFPGTGIGLATVQRIIHRHGGEVWAEGEVNRGATFYFTLQS